LDLTLKFCFKINILGINVIRDTRTAAINSEGFPALTTQAALDSLFDSLQRNKEFELNQICNLGHSKDNGRTDALCLSSKPDLAEHGERRIHTLQTRRYKHTYIHTYIHT